MPSAARICRMLNDAIDTLDATKGRVVQAEAHAKGRDRRASQLGTIVTGSRGGDTTYSNPTQDDSFRLLATMEQGETEAAAIKQAAYHLANLFAEFAPNRPSDGGIRRCGEDNCAKPHVAKGRCDQHRKQFERAKAKREAAEGDGQQEAAS